MKSSTKVGVSFGLTSAIITTLGLFIGLSAATGDKLIVIGGILTIAIADAFSDALGIHISEESDKKNKKKTYLESNSNNIRSKINNSINLPNTSITLLPQNSNNYKYHLWTHTSKHIQL